MAVVIETVLHTDLTKMVQEVPIEGSMFSGDSSANKIIVHITKKGKAVTDLTGEVTAYIHKPNGVVAERTGSISGNKVSVTLPATAYAIVGPVRIVIKVGTTTVGACRGYVQKGM